jgi:hypothetical protein
MNNFLGTLNQLFEAGIAITALSLFIRALTFNLQDRVSRAFAVILACIVIGFAGEVISGAVVQASGQEAWLRFHWIGTIFIPAAYMHFSDALLETTGRPSRGRRRLVVRLAYIISAAFLFTLPNSLLVGPLVPNGQPFPYLSRTTLSWVFTGYYAVVIFLALQTIWRARRRTVLSASHRRMTYMLGSSTALAIGAYPFLLLGSEFASGNPLLFLIAAALGNFLVFYSLIAMAYATAFFGIAWPDRVIRSRLFKWLLRGPMTVFVVLAIIPLVSMVAAFLGTSDSVVLPILIVLSVLLIEHLITLAAPVWERWIFAESEGGDVQLLQTLQERVLTSSDLRQFLESILAAACDQFQTRTAFVAALDGRQMDLLVEVGDKKLLGRQDLAADLLQVVENNISKQEIFSWGDYWLTPVHAPNEDEIFGLLGVLRENGEAIPEEQSSVLLSLAARAGLALDDRRQQRVVLQSLQELTPRMELIQRLRAASRYDQSEVLSTPLNASENEVSGWVKDALNHYWGGPKLTESPLRGLRVVQRAIVDHEGSPANAMRAILREAIERNRPEGEARLNAEWLLFNLLELKFLQGRKVREVARRLAMSEADLYRKQRIAIESVANSLLEMENSIQSHEEVAERIG